MKFLMNSRVVYIAIILLLLFVPMAMVLDPLVLYLLTGSVLMVTSTVAVFMYWPVIHYALMAQVGDVDKTDILTFGIILLFAGTAFREGYITFWRELFPLFQLRPVEYFYPLSFIRYTCIVASIMALCARDMVFEHKYPGRLPGWPTAILSVVAGIAMGFTMIYLQS